jgi:hypothetical protein
MRIVLALAFALAAVLVTSRALANEIDEAHKLALQGRDSYWNCLAREYSPDHIKTMSAQDFTADIAAACPSERQNFRVSLIDYLTMQFPDAESGAHLATANRAIELAQKDVVTAFIRHKSAPN